MSRRITTARGRTIDMSVLTAQNEKIKAVGNVLMNARGDRLNPDGTVKMTVEQMARLDQDRKAPPRETAISDPKPISEKASVAKPVPIPQPISKITKTRDDGTKYVEIEYDDGSIETTEVND
jgi:hypothetical protein